jgi:hypothetical protein
MIPHTRQRGIHGKCPVRVMWNRHNKDDCWRVNMKCSIFDHHTDCGALMGSGVVTRAQMWWLPVVHSMGRNQRIVRSGIKVFTCDVVFIKSEHNTLDGWALSNLNSHDPNGNLVCLSSCLCPKENCKGYNTMFDKIMTTVLTEQDQNGTLGST